MPSLRARLASAVVAWKFSERKNASVDGILDDIRSTWEKENDDEVVPTKTAEVFTAQQSGKTWQVYHIRPRNGPVEVGKVVVYFHGGAFIRRMQDRHWIFVQKLADELKCDVIVPIYTLAPLATGTSCIQTCIELLAHLERDDIRYRNKQFVLTGDSAGGWIALRTLLALVERQTGKVTFRDRQDKVHVSDLKLEQQPEDIDYKAILDSISDDPWLSKNIIDVAARLWSYGPSLAYPTYDFGVPDERKALPTAYDEAGGLLDIEESRFSPVNGLDCLKFLPNLETQFTTVIGTHDILYPSNVRMQERFKALGVKSELHVYEGLFHVFPLLPWLPESMDAFEKIRALFA
ncbi:hypothetical protein QFC21_006296 [Naganishia friedmannii]|uniref:Uncharacterized protein n=1 Tax=Naganishia friedmannii TaxID=89922 RepID=A0ACC2V2X6_9TREE|nr:hypothetical protein QFC21_006296 [Naganishia friedmannii]